MTTSLMLIDVAIIVLAAKPAGLVLSMFAVGHCGIGRRADERAWGHSRQD